jgi:quercetin dioxygenase-like cupin family protein
MLTARMEDLEDQWVEGRPELRWRSTVGTDPEGGARASGSSLLEVDPGCQLARHTDSAEETIVVVSGAAVVTVGEESTRVEDAGIALVPAGEPHLVRNDDDDETLRFVALYAAPEVTTTYEQPVQPGGERERDPLP